MNGTLFTMNSIMSLFRAEILLSKSYDRRTRIRFLPPFAHDLVEVPDVVGGSFTFVARYEGHAEVISSGF